MISDDAIRLRSYLIWEKAGCPSGKALEHWLRAKDELESAYLSSPLLMCQCEDIVVPRLPIRKPPQRLTAERITGGERRAFANAAK